MWDFKRDKPCPIRSCTNQPVIRGVQAKHMDLKSLLYKLYARKKESLLQTVLVKLQEGSTINLIKYYTRPHKKSLNTIQVWSTCSQFQEGLGRSKKTYLTSEGALFEDATITAPWPNNDSNNLLRIIASAMSTTCQKVRLGWSVVS